MHAQREFIHFRSAFYLFIQLVYIYILKKSLINKKHSVVASGYRNHFEARRYWALVEKQLFTDVQERKV